MDDNDLSNDILNELFGDSEGTPISIKNERHHSDVVQKTFDKQVEQFMKSKTVNNP